MIIVIADDITGAAEMGGIALRYGLQTIVASEVDPVAKTDVLVVYTNTRSMKKEQAVEIMASLARKAGQFKPSLFYKKTDSVLRGHILAEMKAQMRELNCSKGLLVPVNPSLGRVISKGKYFVNGEPIHRTGFSTDPEFPVTSSDVLEILGNEDDQARVAASDGFLPENAISVGEAATNEDVFNWTKRVDKNTLAAGGASFFNALLSRAYRQRGSNKTALALSSPSLLISGTRFEKNVQRIKECAHLVSYMPENIFGNRTLNHSEFEKWREDIVITVSKHNKAIIAVDNSTDQKADPDNLREKITMIAGIVLKSAKLEEILIEGGSTAYAVIRKMGWQSFIPTQELQQGIVRMQVKGMADLYLTIKPGSYDWPAEWDFRP